MRIEDIDPLRSKAAYTSAILHSLEQHGLHWDGAVVFQSSRRTHYQDVFDELLIRDAVFPCSCSRKAIRLAVVLPCSKCSQTRDQPEETSWRLRAAGMDLHFLDRIQGSQSARLMPIRDEPVLLRRDGVFAYQLAVVVDDHESGITDVVRGTDLLAETFAQQALYQLLNWHLPSFAHFPVIVNNCGQKLSKQTKAPPLDDRDALQNMRFCLRFLGMAALADRSAGEPIEDLLRQAIHAWQPELLSGIREQTASEKSMIID